MISWDEHLYSCTRGNLCFALIASHSLVELLISGHRSIFSLASWETAYHMPNSEPWQAKFYSPCIDLVGGWVDLCLFSLVIVKQTEVATTGATLGIFQRDFSSLEFSIARESLNRRICLCMQFCSPKYVIPESKHSALEGSDTESLLTTSTRIFQLSQNLYLFSMINRGFWHHLEAPLDSCNEGASNSCNKAGLMLITRCWDFLLRMKEGNGRKSWKRPPIDPSTVVSTLRFLLLTYYTQCWCDA